ncbi:FAD-dependent thymidylate synthase [Prochlorococcus sp. MIT 1300]|uniref:FAD-dependent thymidylate synthase n=1 Tax=Prochlorococcus sp. MIT 1300 TaxID=3096218 RepID=UPI002A74F280|nr:FAD-dependent thymidylate synthase [Prochlorococcus sp. MIT 1300]
MATVELITVTPDAEKAMAYIARVSNPNNQENESYSGLLKYCIKHEHWSVFEQAYMTLQIQTNRGIAAQILRHRSFTFQEFSQRYADSTQLGYIPIPELRRQDCKNRQNSIDDLSTEIKKSFEEKIQQQFQNSIELYESMLKAGVAKECARFILPLATPTRIYMTGSCRSWIHYINLRSGHGTQKEHLQLAEACKVIFCEQFTTVAEALGWHR